MVSRQNGTQALQPHTDTTPEPRGPLRHGAGGVIRLMIGSRVDFIDSSLQSSAGALVGHSAVC